LLESNIRILVIEDNPGDVNLLRAMLHTASESVPQLSFELISAEYLREAVELLSKEKFDLVILDLHLPDSVGIETYQVLSRSLPNTPVIVLSGNDEGDLGLQTVRSGGQDYLIKGQIDGQLLTRSILYSIERHQMRETLRKSNEVLHNVFERTADGILIVDPRNRVLFTNPAAEEMLDRKRGELIGQEVWFPVQSQTPTEVTFRRSGRTTIRVELLNEEIQWHEEKAYLLSLRDITERDRIKVQLQEEVENRTRELLHLNQSLQEQIRERTELEAQLRQSQKMEAIGRLAGGIAHDYNNMLMAIHMCAKKALDPALDNTQRTARISEILLTSERAAAITRQLLAFGRRQELRPEILEVNQELKDCADMLEHLLGYSIELRLILDKEPLQVCVDPGQLQQVFLNLCINSRDALGGKGDIIIRTSLEKRDPPEGNLPPSYPTGDFVVISVEDQGTGIDEETLPKIFEPFFSTKTREEGTGLGLSTVHGIIKQSGGYIHVTSTPGKGTIFKILLPTISQDSPAQKEEHPVVTEKGQAGTILLVEDEPTLLRLLKEALEEEGYTILDASNGRAALEVARSTQAIDMVITDLIMPELDGRNMLRELVTEYPKLQVLLMSGYAYEENPLEDFDLSHYEFIQKPFTESALINRVKRILNRPESTPPAPSNPCENEDIQ